MYSGYKVIATLERMFGHKQLNGFKTVKSARDWWAGQKKKHNKESWADSRNVNKKGQLKLTAIIREEKEKLQ